MLYDAALYTVCTQTTTGNQIDFILIDQKMHTLKAICSLYFISSVSTMKLSLTIDSYEPKCLKCVFTDKVTVSASLTFNDTIKDFPDNIFVELYQNEMGSEPANPWEVYCHLALRMCFRNEYNDATCNCKVGKLFQVLFRVTLLNVDNMRNQKLRLRWTHDSWIHNERQFFDDLLVSNIYQW
ncbi:uncharacterized protein LOC129928322 isoform X1 [Biomphalaria glabrata]|uniref:Uncharacterized protein LOC129928322 isoform X1 n=2 Tax=Biomphalaria glabrata TaxID=6526 RepID=A0A9W3BFF0_BIOGL|nr:uncharacterized protein LOC129928322 isoform X1 [Biomphalaria glabrata]